MPPQIGGSKLQQNKDKIKKGKYKFESNLCVHHLLYLQSDIVSCVWFGCLVVIYLHLSDSDHKTFISEMVPDVSALSQEICFTIFTWCASG